jgi:hypothetical protein
MRVAKGTQLRPPTDYIENETAFLRLGSYRLCQHRFSPVEESYCASTRAGTMQVHLLNMV